MPWFQLALIAGALFFVVSGKNAYDEQRRAEGRAELLPRIEADAAAFREIESYMSAIKANSKAIADRVAVAEKTNVQRVVTEKTRIEYVDRIVPQGSTECERTTDAITKALRK